MHLAVWFCRKKHAFLADAPLGRKLLGGFSLVLLLLLALSAVAYWTTEGNVQASTSVEPPCRSSRWPKRPRATWSTWRPVIAASC